MVVWYIEKDRDFVGVITRDFPDSWGMRKEVQEYKDCTIWIFSGLLWYSLPSYAADSAVWEEGTPPESVLMAKIIGE